MVITAFIGGNHLHNLEGLLKEDGTPTTYNRKEATGTSDQPSSSLSTLTGFQIIPDQCSLRVTDVFDMIYSGGGMGKKQHLREPKEFYSSAQWPPQYSEKSSSGRGSYLGSSTETSLRIIQETIAKYDVRSIVDIPCGDVNWIFDSFETDSIPLYLGLDIVKEVIALNKKRFKHHKNKLFAEWDASKCEIPKYVDHHDYSGGAAVEKSFDLVHIRDVIQHLPIDAGVSFFCNVFKSGAKLMIATTFPDGKENGRGASGLGAFYKNNLFLSPFSFPNDVKCEPTHPRIESDETCIFDLTQPWANTFVNEKCN